MRTKWVLLGIASLFLGALGGALVAPQPAGAVSKEMIELQEQVAQILQAQQDLRSTLDSGNASLKTLLQQQGDAINHLNATMGSLQSAVQQVQANAGSQIGTVAQQTQGLSDNLQDVQARVGKLQQQMSDMQNLLQSIDSKVSAAAPQNPQPQPNGAAPGPGTNGQNGTSTAPATDSNGPAGNNPPMATNTPPGAMPPISADTLYQNALRDYNSGNYPLANQEFSDYIRNFPRNDLASNAQFYLGEILYAQGNYKGAVDSYDAVLTNYPNSFKLSDSLLKKAMAEGKLREHVSAQRDYRLVVRRFPGSPAARKAEAMLREMSR